MTISAWQDHDNNMARAWQEHDNNIMARAWQRHDKNMARASQDHGHNMAITRQEGIESSSCSCVRTFFNFAHVQPGTAYDSGG
jgi:hypothetical protein